MAVRFTLSVRAAKYVPARTSSAPIRGFVDDMFVRCNAGNHAAPSKQRGCSLEQHGIFSQTATAGAIATEIDQTNR